MMRYLLFFLTFTFSRLVEAQPSENDVCPVDGPKEVPCNGPEYRTCPNLPNYRRFCDHDGSIFQDGKPRVICAPCGTMRSLVLDGDYCGDCRFDELVTILPTAMPTLAPVTPAPVSTAPVTLAPIIITDAPIVVTDAPVTPAPVTPAPVTPAPVTPAPVTEEPTTSAPVTKAPIVITDAPIVVTNAPVTAEPITPAPVSKAPVFVTDAPVTAEPITPAPAPVMETEAPVTFEPITLAPATSPPASSAGSLNRFEDDETDHTSEEEVFIR